MEETRGVWTWKYVKNWGLHQSIFRTQLRVRVHAIIIFCETAFLFAASSWVSVVRCSPHLFSLTL